VRKVVVFARQPVPGRVKTRLAAEIGGERAASVYQALLDHTLDVVRKVNADVIVSLAERAHRSWTAALELPTEIQPIGDLGSRLRECFRRRFAEGAERVAIIGSDNPSIAAGHLETALSTLDETRMVLGPAEDGGYWLVAQRSPGIDLFTGIPWSSSSTLDATRTRLRSLGVEWREFDTLADVDTADDLERALNDPRVPHSLRVRLRRL
jgi:rSAM/selenodomain-associated transferase 1